CWSDRLGPGFYRSRHAAKTPPSRSPSSSYVTPGNLVPRRTGFDRLGVPLCRGEVLGDRIGWDFVASLLGSPPRPLARCGGTCPPSLASTRNCQDSLSPGTKG